MSNSKLSYLWDMTLYSTIGVFPLHVLFDIRKFIAEGALIEADCICSDVTTE
jgi:hypothetical protein